MNYTEKKAFEQAIYDLVRTIPLGRATSYGAIAKAIGYPTLSRLVGRVLSNCDSRNNNIPAHRVVNSSGVLSAKEAFGSNNEMEQLLASEGIIVSNDKIKNWKSVFWNPLEEMGI